MNRRNFLATIAALPLMGFLKPKADLDDVIVFANGVDYPPTAISTLLWDDHKRHMKEHGAFRKAINSEMEQSVKDMKKALNEQMFNEDFEPESFDVDDLDYDY